MQEYALQYAHILFPIGIFFLRIIDVSLGTIRIIMIFRGKKAHAAFIGFVEITIFIVALGTVVTNLDNLWNILAYSGGFAGGTLLGSYIEEKLALGFMTVQLIPTRDAGKLSCKLREEGFGVTCFDAWGKEGQKTVLNLHLFRRDWDKLRRFLEVADPGAFVAVMDTRSTKGGYLKLLKKR